MSNVSSPSPFDRVSTAMADAVSAVSPAVLAIQTRHARASGFVWRPGWVVSSEEGLPEDEEAELVLPGGATVAAKVAGRDPSTDVLLLRCEGVASPPVVFDVEPLRAGEMVLAIGAREGLPLVAGGLVSLAGPAWRSLRGGEIDARIELDMRLRLGAEGGVVLNAKGQPVGMAVFGPRRRVLLIPAATIERVAAQLMTHGHMPRGYLGLSLQPVRVDAGSVGAMVMSVAEQGPGAAAGVLQGDVIVAMNGQPIRSVPLLLRALGPASVGTVLVLSLRRAGEAVEARLRVGERPAA
ncbi:putative periplasmic serine endoprotease DegP-like precursor [Variovorax sp. PBS-H4]|uniref:S1C family serine protease n=1 Tax=Variovorax sp. PBS-H4 TaxID=434008 RepID=UPI001318D124|nr:S1C family serine protease [Variovorax sp. PBS-H4]VTU40018.1 putative periplasmic serine endoprotease DegP-like precursor [Variovorax sp. PBS-H4]